MSERSESCKNCRFWENPGPDAVGWGTCRRYPPIKLEFEEFDEGGTARVGQWPDTSEFDWCGEHKPVATEEKSE